jgi:hypothetical protein
MPSGEFLWIETLYPVSHHRRLSMLVTELENLKARPVSPRRDERFGDVSMLENLDSGLDHLGGASVIDRKPDDLNAGEALMNIEEKSRVASVESVNGLRWIADEKKIVVTESQLIEQSLLERGQVLGFIDEKMSESPAGCPSKVRIPCQIRRGHG